MRVGGDEARGEDAVAGVDGLVDGAVERPSHVDDPVALDDHDTVAEQAVALPVEGDDPASPDGDAAGRAHRATMAGSSRRTA